MSTAQVFVVLFFCLQVFTLLRAMLRPYREPAARIAWVAVIASVPFFGMVAYLMFGEVNIGRRHIAKMSRVLEDMPKLPHPMLGGNLADRDVFQDQKFAHLFRLGESISGFEPADGNTAELMADSDIMIDRLVDDIDNATDHVHLLFYIWLPDTNGLKVIDALKRAAARGVTCRVMADNMGSRTMVGSGHWTDLSDNGVKTAVLLPIGNPFLRILIGRIDVRNHRKIVVIDRSITYCGSQNCADPAFLPKHKYAPWVDTMLRLEGPVALQNQHLFASDWMSETSEDISSLLHDPVPPRADGFSAQAIGTGPTDRHMAMSQMFVATIAAAREKLTITTPYFVPNEAIQSALQSAAYRGVDTTLVVPERNDSHIVQAASRSYYEELLFAGVKIYEFGGGLLHAKTMTVDDEFLLVGSANLDRRSFDLNYENNLLIQDEATTKSVFERQLSYLNRSRPVLLDEVRDWSVPRRLWNNALALVGPVL